MFRAVLPPGGATGPQFHDHEEIVHVLSGRGAMRVADEVREIGVGDVVIIPRGCVHDARCVDDDWDVVISMPAGATYTAGDGTVGTPPPWMF